MNSECYSFFYVWQTASKSQWLSSTNACCLFFFLIGSGGSYILADTPCAWLGQTGLRTSGWFHCSSVWGPTKEAVATWAGLKGVSGNSNASGFLLGVSNHHFCPHPVGQNQWCDYSNSSGVGKTNLPCLLGGTMVHDKGHDTTGLVSL